MRKISIIIFLLCLSATLLLGQLKVTAIKKIKVPASQTWNCPTFSPDGKTIFLTNSTLSGIWKFNPSSSAIQKITQDRSSGMNYVVSPDGNQVTFRRSKETKVRGTRVQELVQYDLRTKAEKVLSSGTNLSNPVLMNSRVVYSKGTAVQNLSQATSAGSIAVAGVENTKIILIHNGKKVVFDPLTNGSYIWPSLSPDRKKIVAYEVDRGTFVCDLDGKNLTMLGRLDAPSWTRDGNWIVYMNDKDDGHRILSSDLYAITLDGKTSVQLTSTKDVMEMNPMCSQTENKLICNSPTGEIFELTYEVVR
jgi:Tol biopolymer transport system component